MMPGAWSIWRRRVVARMTENLSRAFGPTGTTGYRGLDGDADCRTIVSALSNGPDSGPLRQQYPGRLFHDPTHRRLDSDARSLARAGRPGRGGRGPPVSYTHLRAHETPEHL